jgi:hypothetical protein
MNEGKESIPEGDKIEKQKLLYDLSYKQFETHYREIPESLRDRIIKLFPLFSAVFLFIPALIEKIVASKLAPVAFYFVSFFSGIAVVAFIAAIVFAVRLIYTKKFYFHSPPKIRSVIQDEGMELEIAYKNVVQHLISAAEDNEAIHKQMASHFEKAIVLFFVAVGIGTILYTALLL